MNLTGIHLGSYWMGKNDVVALMAQELQSVSRATLVDTRIYGDNADNWYEEVTLPGHTFAIRWINDAKLRGLVRRLKPDYIILNAGGMALRPNTALWLKKQGVISVGIELSDPDVFTDNGQVYSHLFDLYYTNSLYSLKAQYPVERKYHWLPFAASPSTHKPSSRREIYDIVVVGHARPERLKTVAMLAQHFSVATFGAGWSATDTTVHGEAHMQAINSGRIYLSFAKTYAGYSNIKVGLFEAAACKTCIVTEYMPEMDKLFTYGIDVVGYTSETSLKEAISYYLDDPIAREWVATNCYQRTLNEHTWEHRWKGVLNDIQEVRKSRGIA